MFPGLCDYIVVLCAVNVLPSFLSEVVAFQLEMKIFLCVVKSGMHFLDTKQAVIQYRAQFHFLSLFNVSLQLCISLVLHLIDLGLEDEQVVPTLFPNFHHSLPTFLHKIMHSLKIYDSSSV